jgi:hypothetical protein
MGIDCSETVDFCSMGICQNGGTCISMIGYYECECMPNFSGQHCENERNFCESDPCTNEGNCIPITFGFVCECNLGSVVQTNIDVYQFLS